MASQKLLRRLVELAHDFYGIVHEFKNILNRVLAYIDLHSNYQDRICSDD